MAADWVLVLTLSFITALATGLGALPLVLLKRTKRFVGLGNAAAAGFMLAVSILLIHQGLQIGVLRTALGLFLGLVLVIVAQRLVPQDAPSISSLKGADAKSAFLILLVMTAHSFAEGIGVGVSFGAGQDFGILIALAIAVQNIPEGLAISLILVPRGVSVWKAAGWSVFSSLPQPLMAIPAFVFVLVFEPLLPIGLGLAAGAMIWMVFSEVYPDALANTDAPSVATTATAAVVLMVLLETLL